MVGAAMVDRIRRLEVAAAGVGLGRRRRKRLLGFAEKI
jgi:hypothetical protein